MWFTVGLVTDSRRNAAVWFRSIIRTVRQQMEKAEETV